MNYHTCKLILIIHVTWSLTTIQDHVCSHSGLLFSNLLFFFFFLLDSILNQKVDLLIQIYALINAFTLFLTPCLIFSLSSSNFRCFSCLRSSASLKASSRSRSSSSNFSLSSALSPPPPISEKKNKSSQISIKI